MCVVWTLLCRWKGRPKKIIAHLDINNCSRVLPALRVNQSFSTHQCKYTASCVGCCAWKSRNTRHSRILRSVYRNSCHHTLDTAQEPEECDLYTTGDLLRLGPRWRPFAFHVRAANGCSPGFQLRQQSTPERAESSKTNHLCGSGHFSARLRKNYGSNQEILRYDN